MRARWVAAVTVAVAAGVVVALAFALHSTRPATGVRALPLTHRFASAREGIRVRFPRGWRATTHNETFVPDPALCVTLDARRSHVQVKFVEYLPPALRPSDLTGRDPSGQLFYPHRRRRAPAASGAADARGRCRDRRQPA